MTREGKRSFNTNTVKEGDKGNGILLERKKTCSHESRLLFPTLETGGRVDGERISVSDLESSVQKYIKRNFFMGDSCHYVKQ